jgi:hypothetical protein
VLFFGIVSTINTLYPKFFIFSPIEQYIVRVRLEDFVVAIAVLFTGSTTTEKRCFDKTIAF